MSFLFALGYGLGLRYPMDASSFASVCGCLILLVYTGSMLLTVQFRGDYGVMPDYQDTTTAAADMVAATNSQSGGGGYGSASRDDSGSSNGQSQLFQRANRKSPLSASNNSNGSAFAFAEHNGGGGTTSSALMRYIRDRFSIPLGDANLLFYPASPVYGSKLYNLKDDFKDL